MKIVKPSFEVVKALVPGAPAHKILTPSETSGGHEVFHAPPPTPPAPTSRHSGRFVAPPPGQPPPKDVHELPPPPSNLGGKIGEELKEPPPEPVSGERGAQPEIAVQRDELLQGRPSTDVAKYVVSGPGRYQPGAGSIVTAAQQEVRQVTLEGPSLLPIVTESGGHAELSGVEAACAPNTAVRSSETTAFVKKPAPTARRPDGDDLAIAAASLQASSRFVEFRHLDFRRPGQYADGRHSRCGWITFNGDSDTDSEHAKNGLGYSEFAQNASHFDAIHPAWYAIQDINPDIDKPRIGKWIQLIGDVDTSKVVDIANRRIQIIPLVAGGTSPDATVEFLHRAIAAPEFVDDLVTLASNPLYHGIDLDWEGLELDTDAPLLFNFLDQLAPRLQSIGRVLSFDPPGLGFRNLTDPRRMGVLPFPAYQYSELAKRCTQIHIQGYDFHEEYQSQESIIGSVAPQDWIVDVCLNAKNTGQPWKFSLGLPGYGIHWSRTSWVDVAETPVLPNELLAGVAPTIVYSDDHLATCQLNDLGLYGPHESYSPHATMKYPPYIAAYNTAQGAYANNPTQANLDAVNAAKAKLDASSTLFTWYFDDIESLRRKVKAAFDAGLVGITLWVVGDEGDDFYSMVAKYFPRVFPANQRVIFGPLSQGPQRPGTSKP